MEIVKEICAQIERGKAKEVKELTAKALEEGIAPDIILNDAMIPAMSAIGVRFKNNEVFVPEVLIAARAMNMGLEVLRPALKDAGVQPVGKAIICTVKGDLHDIGKNLVKMMLEGAGIECIDLGVDVSSDKIIKAINESGAKVVCLSSLLTTTMPAQKTIIADLVKAGVRNKVKVLVGGAPVTQSYADEIGADAYAPDAASAAQVAVSYF
ncbi:MAG: corrinoid protein [Christensenellales bacterium]|jgi:5-methyltetrahydrofolate--homocysteine methyltransferase